MNGPASTPSVYTEAEERANCLTHAAGVLLGLVGMAVLVALSARRGDIWDVVAACVFGTSLVLLYTASTLYHAFREPEAKRLLRKFDHAAIFLLIAGTYTPFLLVSLRGTWGWSLFGIIWGLAVAGIVLKFWFAGRFTIVSTLLYLAMGWLVVVATRPMLAAVAPPQLWLLLAGGLCYTGARCSTCGAACRTTMPSGTSSCSAEAAATTSPCTARSCGPCKRPRARNSRGGVGPQRRSKTRSAFRVVFSAALRLCATSGSDRS